MKAFVVFIFSAGVTVLCQSGFDPLKDIGEVGTHLNILPECIFGVDEVGFVVYTRQLPEGYYIDISNTSVIPIDTNKETIFLVHGFISDANNTNYYALASAWLEKDDVNIFSLDWKEGACNGGLAITDALAYPSAIKNTKIVGEYLANFTKLLIDEYDLCLEKLLIVGHSLGAHVCGYAGKTFRENGWGVLPEIIGLDPAGPGFEGKPCSDRLCESDARFVDANHASFVLGIHMPIADVDIYFNGGAHQPGCILSTCSHSRVIEYFTESIKNPDCKFIGRRRNESTGVLVPISNCTDLLCTVASPYTADYPARGVFFVETNSSPPFCRDGYRNDTSWIQSLNGSDFEGNAHEKNSNGSSDGRNDKTGEENDSSVFDKRGHLVGSAGNNSSCGCNKGGGSKNNDGSSTLSRKDNSKVKNENHSNNLFGNNSNKGSNIKGYSDNSFENSNNKGYNIKGHSNNLFENGNNNTLVENNNCVSQCNNNSNLKILNDSDNSGEFYIKSDFNNSSRSNKSIYNNNRFDSSSPNTLSENHSYDKEIGSSEFNNTGNPGTSSRNDNRNKPKTENHSNNLSGNSNSSESNNEKYSDKSSENNSSNRTDVKGLSNNSSGIINNNGSIVKRHFGNSFENHNSKRFNNYGYYNKSSRNNRKNDFNETGNSRNSSKNYNNWSRNKGHFDNLSENGNNDVLEENNNGKSNSNGNSNILSQNKTNNEINIEAKSHNWFGNSKGINTYNKKGHSHNSSGNHVNDGFNSEDYYNNLPGSKNYSHSEEINNNGSNNNEDLANSFRNVKSGKLKNKNHSNNSSGNNNNNMSNNEEYSNMLVENNNSNKTDLKDLSDYLSIKNTNNGPNVKPHSGNLFLNQYSINSLKKTSHSNNSFRNYNNKSTSRSNFNNLSGNKNNNISEKNNNDIYSNNGNSNISSESNSSIKFSIMGNSNHLSGNNKHNRPPPNKEGYFHSSSRNHNYNRSKSKGYSDNLSGNRNIDNSGETNDDISYMI